MSSNKKKNMNRKECEDYGKNGMCEVLGCKCKEVEKDDCPCAVNYYDPYYAGDCEDF